MSPTTTATEHSDLGAEGSVASIFSRERTRVLGWTAALTILLAFALVVAMNVGAVSVSPGQMWQVLVYHLSGSSTTAPPVTLDAIIWDVRAPRVLLAAVAGAGLAIAGVALQAIVRNELADPYVLGVNSGASLGAALAILFGFGAALGQYSLQASAFVGALLAMALVLLVARGSGRLSSLRILIAGVAVGYALSAATSFLVFASDSAEGSRSVMFWLLGSLNLAAWDGPLWAACAAVVGSIAVLMWLSRSLDILALGDDTALSSGVDPARLRLILIVIISLLVGAMVATTGSIGFVGLVVPHFARRIVGARHKVTIPAAALMGAILLVCADVLARWVLAPQEIPIGVVTALVGTPLLLILVRRMDS